MSDDPPATLPAIMPLRKQAGRLIRAIKYICSDSEDRDEAIAPALATIELMQSNLENIKQVILLLEAQRKAEKKP